MKIFLLTGIFLLLNVTNILGATRLNEIKPINEWTGKTRIETHMKAAPESGLITDNETWNELWKKWKPAEAIPDIEFGKDFVLVQQVRGPNQVMVNNLELKDGTLTFQTGASRMGGPGFGFALLQLSRDGVQKVKETELPDVPRDEETKTEADESGENGKAEAGMAEASGFKTISIETSGGFAGLMKVEKVTPDGKIVVESTKDGSKIGERQLNVEQVAQLIRHVDAADWSTIPKTADSDSRVADGMQHIIKIELANEKKFEFEYGSITANSNESIRKLMQIVAGQKPR